MVIAGQFCWMKLIRLGSLTETTTRILWKLPSILSPQTGSAGGRVLADMRRGGQMIALSRSDQQVATFCDPMYSGGYSAVN
jgi:hypothetical protein